MDAPTPSILRAAATGSGACQWRNCPASVALALGIEEREKKYATEGTIAHKKAEEYAKNNTPLEEIEDEAIRVYVAFIRKTHPGPYIVEKRLPLLGSSGGIDCYVVDSAVKTAYLFDLKFGIGKRLDCFENEQIAFYACAIKEAHPEVTMVHCWIIQPRIEGVFEDVPSITSWSLPYQTLAMWRREFERALIEVEKAEKLHVGKWCQFCKTKGGCPAHLAHSEAMEKEMNNLPAVTFSQLPSADIPRIAHILYNKDRIEAFLKAAEEYLFFKAQEGVPIPGFELGKGRTNRKWHCMLDEREVAQALRERGVLEPYVTKLISPAKAEEQTQESIEDLWEKPEGATKLKKVKLE